MQCFLETLTDLFEGGQPGGSSRVSSLSSEREDVKRIITLASPLSSSGIK